MYLIFKAQHTHQKYFCTTSRKHELLCSPFELAYTTHTQRAPQIKQIFLDINIPASNFLYEFVLFQTHIQKLKVTHYTLNMIPSKKEK